jgi:hypothetical protein
MKISGSFITMLIIWALGFTHFLGGPYIFFKVIFWLALLPFFIAIFMLILVAFKARKIFKTTTEETPPYGQETIHVEVEVKE